MSAQIISGRIQFRRGDAAAWTSANPVLLDGELGLESDTGKFKFGDGTTSWNSLIYAGGSGASPTIATQAEMEAGTNNTKMATPLGVKEAIDYNKPTITYY